ncbi:hypothetical protein RchiOBHm_Chr2g0153391 [Rosa chinensis]|uniref:Uncharacterized protein n=1 Tax=Rosa chinensis TaxID=74649 RepID=A0A2P6S0N5_ROSCH|nr:hypothetical protein RchiOBHm_Chr2g0153391 [Rosa chinensis]
MLILDYIEDNAIFKCGGRDLHFYLESYILKNTNKQKKSKNVKNLKKISLLLFLFLSLRMPFQLSRIILYL